MPSMALQELVDEAYRKLAGNRGRLMDSTYPVYKGQTIAPMSVMTQKARDLTEKYGSKPSPYTNKIERILKNNSQGLDQNQLAAILDMLRAGQENFNQNTTQRILRKQFGAAVDPRLARLENKSQKDLNLGIGEFTKGWNDIGKATANLESLQNQAAVKALQGLSTSKAARRQALIGNLQEFGNQKHTHINMVNDAERRRFDDEVNAPYKQAASLSEILARNGNPQANDFHPDLDRIQAKEIEQGLRAFSNPHSPYPGEMVAPITPDMQASYNLLMNVSPKYQDAYHADRKALVNDIVSGKSSSQKTLENLPESVRSAIERLEADANGRLKKDRNAINNQYVGRGTYGSGSHLRTIENRAREINKATLDERNKILEAAYGKGLNTVYDENINNLKRIGQMQQQGDAEYGDMIGDIRTRNALGATKWRNQQQENEQLYKNYQNEKAREWPHMRQKIGQQGFDQGAFAGYSVGSLNLDELRNKVDAAYSELEKEKGYSNSLQEQINNLQSYKTQREIEMQKAAEQERVAAERRAYEAKVARNMELIRRSQQQEKSAQVQTQPQADWRTRGNYYLPESVMQQILGEHQKRASKNSAYNEVIGLARQHYNSYPRQNGTFGLTETQLNQFTSPSLNTLDRNPGSSRYGMYKY